MSLAIGIIGLPNVGKSTFFNCLSEKEVPAENYPFCTIEPSVCNCLVEDFRLDNLNLISNSANKINTFVKFIDIAGLIEGASKGEGLGNKFLSNVREADALCQVVRIFQDEKIIHTRGTINPMDDIEIINLELIQADKETVFSRMQKIARQAKTGEKSILFEKTILEKALNFLNQDKFLNNLILKDEEYLILKRLNLLTIKKMFFVLNKKSGVKNLDDANSPEYQKIINYFKENQYQYLILDILSEYEFKKMPILEIKEFRSSMGLESGIEDVIKKAYDLLDLITFFTTGQKETRAWTIKRGDTAPMAASKIHTDFEKKFIKAEVIKLKDFFEFKSKTLLKEKGLLKIEGRDYIVQDGDVLEFKIN